MELAGSPNDKQNHWYIHTEKKNIIKKSELHRQEPLDIGTSSPTMSRPAPASVNLLLGWLLSTFKPKMILSFLTLVSVVCF